MLEYLGFLSAVLVLLAALFGLIPPLLSSSSGGSRQSDKAASDLIGSFKPFVVMGGTFGLFLFFMHGMYSLQDVAMSNSKYATVAEAQPVELRNINDDDRNLVLNADLISNSTDRDAALVEIVDLALEDKNFALATLAASEISRTKLSDEQLKRIQKQILLHRKSVVDASSQSDTEQSNSE